MKILYICKDNLISQIAESYQNCNFREHKAFSAGTNVSGFKGSTLFGIQEIIPEARHIIKVMRERDFDVSRKIIKPLNPELLEITEIVIVIGNEIILPSYLVKLEKDLIYWDLPYLKNATFETYFEVRNKIMANIDELFGVKK